MAKKCSKLMTPNSDKLREHHISHPHKIRLTSRHIVPKCTKPNIRDNTGISWREGNLAIRTRIRIITFFSSELCKWQDNVVKYLKCSKEK
jgi:hypothetical protein